MEDHHLLPARVQNVVDMQIVPLNMWTIKFTASNIVLEGFVRSDDGNMMHKMQSQYICKRMTATLLLDVSGRFFELVGSIDRNFQLKNGMPSNIVDEFQNGFPENWAFLITRSLTKEQISSRKSIQCAPVVPPIVPQSAPIVTLADDSDMDQTKKSVSEEPKKTEVKKQNSNIEIVDNEADVTFRAGRSDKFDAVTPIRWERKKNGDAQHNTKKVFEETPIRTKPSTDLEKIASSTPIPEKQISAPKQFVVPDLPMVPPKEPSRENVGNEGGGVFGALDGLFQEVTFSKTPNLNTTRARPPKRLQEEDRSRRHESPPDYYYNSTRNSKYDDRDNGYRYHSRDRYESPEYMSRHGRKRERWDSRSPTRFSSEEDRYHRRRWEENRFRSGAYDREDNRYRTRYDEDCDNWRERKNQRYRADSPSSSRAVRWEDERLNKYENEWEQMDRKERYLKNKLNMAKRTQSEIVKKPQSKRRSEEYDDDEDEEEEEDFQNVWARQNENLLDTPIGNRKQNDGRSRAKSCVVTKKEKKVENKKTPVKREKKPKEKQIVDANDSIASTRPRRACATPASVQAAPKKLTWPKRDLDKLKRVIEMKKPTDDEEDWQNISRLVAKEGADGKECKQVAISRLKWKVVEKKEDEKEKEYEEEEEQKRRKGIAAAVKEDLKLREEMMGGNRKEKNNDVLEGSIESIEDINAADVSADGSLLGACSPIKYTAAVRTKGGKRKSFIPEPVEDSPLRKSLSSSPLTKSPRTEAARMKEMETTMKYVKQLTTMQARPGSRNNRTMDTTANTSRIGHKKGNVSMSVEEGNRRAMKMMSKANVESIEEEEDSDRDEVFEDDEENAMPY